MNRLFTFLAVIFNCCTSMVGYQIHHSLFWSIMDWVFSPFAWAKWLICHEVSLTIIKQTFAFLLN